MATRNAAKANDPSTWTDFDFTWNRYQQGGYYGVGFIFSKNDEFCGIDLDGCRDPETGEVTEWAQKIIDRFRTYTEVSREETGQVQFLACLRRREPTGRPNQRLGVSHHYNL